MKAKSLLILAAMMATAGAGAKAATHPSKNEIMSAYAGNTLYEDGSWYEFAGLYKADGTIDARGWNMLGEERSGGTWRITKDGEVCMTWERKNWALGKENCYSVEIDGNKTSMTHVSGEGGESRSFIIKPGNPYNL